MHIFPCHYQVGEHRVNWTLLINAVSDRITLQPSTPNPRVPLTVAEKLIFSFKRVASGI
jgi:hypothetical protein